MHSTGAFSSMTPLAFYEPITMSHRCMQVPRCVLWDTFQQGYTHSQEPRAL